jgi:dTMP kinase
MKVFVTSETNGLQKEIVQLGHEVVDGDHSGNPEEIFTRRKSAIEASDCVVAEVTKADANTGGEIVYALTHKKPVLALFYKDAPNQLSAMIAGNPSENLFLEHYDDEGLPIILKHFFDQVEILAHRKGKLIVIDGGDGSGKTTQSEMLVTYFQKHQISVKAFDFPRYYSSFHGNLAGRFLAGEFGDASPYLASLAYALDRASAKEEMDSWLARGGMIVSNRYATSNMAHQGARLPEEKRKEFLAWIDELEYKVHKIPREDLVIYLHVPWQVGLELSKKKGERGYLGKHGKDILETDMNHRSQSEQMYLWLSKERTNWIVIECIDENGMMLTKEEIHKKIVELLKQKNIL